MENSFNSKHKNKLEHILQVVKEHGFDLTPKSIILDFGCGSGGIVQELRSREKQAFGCDFNFKDERNVNTGAMFSENIIRTIAVNPYKIAFEDNTFDFIFSEQVFEHVSNYSETISEICRVLKPGGFCLHIFPSRFIPIEPHVRVPFSSINNSYPWLLFWAKMGIRKKSQIGFSPHETAIENFEYLKKHTNYLSKKQITINFKEFFNDVVFCEKLFLKYSKRGHFFYKLFQYTPFIFKLYGTFWNRVVMVKTPIKKPKGVGDGHLGVLV